MHEIYLYGSILASDSFILEGEFPKGDQYAEYTEHHTHIGGETGVAMAILGSFGIPVMGDGYHQGTYTMPILKEYFKSLPVDISRLTYRTDFEGLHDYVFIDRVNNTRNCIGPFATLPRKMGKLQNAPKEEDIADAKVLGIDPFQGEESFHAAEYAVWHKKPYVTIDCPPDSFLAKNCAVAAISDEFLSATFPGKNPEELMKKYMEGGDGLYIFTFGSREVLYGRKGKIQRTKPFKVKALSTLGAGDTFKTGCIYGLYKGMADDELVRFACAIAACAVSVYPLAEHLPTLEQINKLLSEK